MKTETGRKRDVPVVERFTLTDDLGDVMERVIDAVDNAGIFSKAVFDRQNGDFEKNKCHT